MQNFNEQYKTEWKRRAAVLLSQGLTIEEVAERAEIVALIGHWRAKTRKEKTRGVYYALFPDKKPPKYNPKPLENKIKPTSSEYKEDMNKGEAEISLKTYTQVKTLDQLITECEIDITVWDIERWVCNKWEVGAKQDEGMVVTPLYQIKVWLKKKVASQPSLIEFKNDLIESIKAITPPIRTQTHSHKEGVLVEIDIFDPHFGKLAWSPETGEDYDLKIAEERYFNALYDLLEKASAWKIKQILLPIGNDWFHYDTLAVTTTAGTRQDSDSRWQKMFRVGTAIAIKAIEICERIAPTHVIHVPSNHDEQSGFYMHELLQARFMNHPRITIDGGLKSRKYYKWGKCGIGFTHGHNEKASDLPNIMLIETRQDWIDVIFMEWHTGHIHTKKEIKYLMFAEYRNVIVRTIRSISGVDSWHSKQGYIGGLKGAEAFVWDENHGNIANIHSILI